MYMAFFFVVVCIGCETTPQCIQHQHLAGPLASSMLSQKLWLQNNMGGYLEIPSLADGKHPTRDPDNKPLEKGSVASNCIPKPKRYKTVLWGVIGDHEFFSNSLGIPATSLE